MNGLGGLSGLDFVIIGVAAAGAIYGLSRGALRMVTSVAALIVGIYLASADYSRAGQFLARQFAIGASGSAVLGYAAVFLVVFVAIQVAGEAAARLLRTVNLGWLDRLGGAIVGAAVACVLVGLAVMLMTAILPPNAALLRDSRLAPAVLAYNAELSNYVPDEVRQAYEERRQDLLDYWVKRARNSFGLTDPDAQPTVAPAR